MGRDASRARWSAGVGGVAENCMCGKTGSRVCEGRMVQRTKSGKWVAGPWPGLGRPPRSSFLGGRGEGAARRDAALLPASHPPARPCTHALTHTHAPRLRARYHYRPWRCNRRARSSGPARPGPLERQVLDSEHAVAQLDDTAGGRRGPRGRDGGGQLVYMLMHEPAFIIQWEWGVVGEEGIPRRRRVRGDVPPC
jgi:hypothetical protein